MTYLGSKDFLTEVAKGNVAGHSLVHKFGRNAAVGTSFVPVSIGGLYHTLQVGAATALRVKAGNTNDTAAGTGAQEVTLEGLDETGAAVSEAVATAGTSASSPTSATFIRLHRAYVSASGTYATASAGSHAADIVIENGAGGTDWATISTDGATFPRSQTEIGIYSIPAGVTGHFLGAEIHADTAKTTNLLFFQRTGILQTSAPYDAMRIIFEETTKAANSDFKPRSPIAVQGPADVGFMAKVDSATSEVDIDFELLLVND